MIYLSDFRTPSIQTANKVLQFLRTHDIHACKVCGLLIRTKTDVCDSCEICMFNLQIERRTTY